MEPALTSEGGSRGSEEEMLERRVRTRTKVLFMHGDSLASLRSGLDIPEEVVETADQYDQNQKYAKIAEEIKKENQVCRRLLDYHKHLFRISWVNWENHVPDFAQIVGSYA